MRQGLEVPVFYGIIASGAVPFCRFVTRVTSAEDTMQLSGAAGEAVGVSEQDLRMTNPDLSLRTGYQDKEVMRVRRTGLAVIETGGSFNIGDKVQSDSTGRAVVYTDVAPSAGYVQAEAVAAANAYKICRGTSLQQSTGAGQFVVVDIEQKP